MTLQRWQQLETLFQAALERPATERAAFLNQACADDAALRQEVEALLASFQSANKAAAGFLETPAVEGLGLAAASPRVAGERIAHYEILSALGTGGMGEVYLARDPRLERRIALKLLPAQFSRDAEWVQRFTREARAASALNHPNILTIYEIGEDAGTHFIAMEFVAGRTLRQQLAAGRLSVREASGIARQIADALSSAHEAGIIHRDIKPENVIVRPDGLVKLLDFGLAKPTGLGIADRGSRIEKNLSEAGLQTDPKALMGTLAYLSPEQVRGEAVDYRTDIFSLGVVIYEMLAGVRPFTGQDVSETLAAIQQRVPEPITDQPPAAAALIEGLINRALAKEPAARYQSADTLRDDLRQLARQFETSALASHAPVRQPWRKFTSAALLGGLLIVFATGWWLWPRLKKFAAPAQPGETTSPWINADSVRLTGYPGMEFFPSLAPDGQSLVYARVINQQYDLIARRIGEAQVGEAQERNLTTDSPADDLMPAHSPDGARIAFRSGRNGGGIFVMNADGTNLQQLTREGFSPAWSPEGQQIVYATEGPTTPHLRTGMSSLRVLNLNTGALRQLPTGDAVQPHWSPGGQRIAYWGLRGTQRDLWTVAANGGEPLAVTNDAATDWNPVWSPDGRYLYYVRADRGAMRFWRVPIDESSGRVRGAPEAVTGAASESWHPTLSRDGRRLAYVQYGTKENLQRSGFDPKTGRPTGNPVPITSGERRVTSPSLSPDGAWLAFYSFGNPQEDLFIIRPDGSGQRQLTDDRFSDRARGWSPDNQQLLFASDRSGCYEIWSITRDGQQLRQMTWCGGGGCHYACWSPDGRRLAIYRQGAHSFLLETGKPWQAQTPVVLPPLPESDSHFLVWAWSPDGEQLVGWQRKTNGEEAGLFIYSLATRQYERLTHFGTDPSWLNDNRRLLFSQQRRLWLVDCVAKQPREIFRLDPLGITRAVLSPNNRQLYYSQIAGNADIWLLSLGGSLPK